MAKAKSVEQMKQVEAQENVGPYAEAGLDTEMEKSESQEPGDGKDWSYAKAGLDSHGGGQSSTSARPGTPAASVEALLNRKS